MVVIKLVLSYVLKALSWPPSHPLSDDTSSSTYKRQHLDPKGASFQGWLDKHQMELLCQNKKGKHGKHGENRV